MDIFRKDDGSTVAEGRKKVYITQIPMKLLLPDGSDDGVLDKDDLVYVLQSFNKGDGTYYRFMVMKFADTNKEKKLYCGDSKFFKRHFDEQSNVIGEEEKDEPKKETNYKVPIITGLALGMVSYLIADKFNKNALLYGILGVAVGIVGGHYMVNKGLNSKDIKNNK
jgi:hypothetical protein